jgi:hypothetical protein
MVVPESWNVEGKITDISPTLVLAGPLVAALVAVVPVVALVGEAVGIGLLPSMLAALAVVGISYLTFSFHQGCLIASIYVAFFILSTFFANVPIGADAKLYRLTPGSLGPQVWLYQAPLVVLVGYFLWRREFSLRSIAKPEIVFGAFVGWTVLSALLGAGPRTGVALSFTWLMIQALVVLGVVRRGVQRNIISLEAVITTYVVAVFGHMAFGAAQLINQHPFGLRFLGEMVEWAIVSYPPGIENRVIPSGLTGHGYVLVAIILLTFPSMILHVYRSDSVRGIVALFATVMMAGFLRLTTSDAGRGAFLVLALCLLVGTVLFTWVNDSKWRPSLGKLRSVAPEHQSRVLRGATALALGVVAVLYPSSQSGARSEVSDVAPAENGSATPNITTSTPTTDAPTNTPDVSANTPSAPMDSLSETSIPLFDLSHLGGRLQQYVVALAMFFDHPVFGVGGGNFRFVASRYGLSDAPPPNVSVPLPVHNVYIMLLAEHGFPGFLLYTGTIGLVLIAGVTSILRNHKGQLHLAVLAGIVAYSSFMVFTHLIDNAIALLPFWALAGAVLGEYSKTARIMNKASTRADD